METWFPLAFFFIFALAILFILTEERIDLGWWGRWHDEELLTFIKLILGCRQGKMKDKGGPYEQKVLGSPDG